MSLIRSLLIGLVLVGAVQAEEEAPSSTPLTPFTGKVTKSRVRLRLEPNLDGVIIEELNQGDLLVIDGEEEDFYAVRSLPHLRGFIYRTYVMDDIVEGNHVNIRLSPDLESPIVGQANTGEKLLNAQISPLNGKWLEFTLPNTIRFHVSKHYIEKVGDADFLVKQAERRLEARRLLETTHQLSQEELQKPFNEINLTTVFGNFTKVITEFSDIPDQVQRANELITKIQDDYSQKKLSFLGRKNETVTEEWELKNAQLTAEIEAQKRRLEALRTPEEPTSDEEKVTRTEQRPTTPLHHEKWPWEEEAKPNSKMTAWIPMENHLYEAYVAENGDLTMSEFYNKQQKDDAVALRGIIEPYVRAVKNKPGDYLLLSPVTKHPIAYLYSTRIDLQNYNGREVNIFALPRPNNHFAFPAYYVVSVQ